MISGRYRYKRKIILLVTVCLILSIFVGAKDTKLIIGTSEEPSQPSSNYISSLTPHSTILIENDDNFTDYGFTGNGSESEPFIIENYNITVIGAIGIHIAHTTKFFVIRNCFIDSSSLGIRIQYKTLGNASIFNNTFIIGHSDGIQISYSNYVTISNNTCIGKYRENGIVLSNSDYCIVENNTAYNSGIRIVHGGTNHTIQNNDFHNCGLDIIRPTYAECSSYTIEINTVNDKPLAYFIDQTGLIIQNSIYGQLMLVNCDNSRIENQIISNAFNGISLFYCRDSSISNNTCNNNTETGIYLFEASSNIIQNNTCAYNLENGIFLHFSISCIASDNELLNNGNRGIYLISATNSMIYDNLCLENSWTGISGFYASSATIENNLCIGSEIYGIGLDISPYSIISNNTCLSNEYKGIYLRSSEDTEISLNTINNTEGDGIHIQYTSNIHIYNNSCSQNVNGINNRVSDIVIIEANILFNNSKYGIKIYDSNLCILTYNHLENNTEYGIYLLDSSSCTIHHNNFVNNYFGSTSQAYDSGGTNNVWYNIYSDEGNYWSNYLGSGFYYIDGDSNSYDPYPLENQSVPILKENIIISFIPLIAFSTIVFLILRKRKNRVSNKR